MHSTKRETAEFFALMCFYSSRYYKLATMSARMPLKGGDTDLFLHNNVRYRLMKKKNSLSDFGQQTWRNITPIVSYVHVPLRGMHHQPCPSTQGKKPKREICFEHH